jgi:hypothetical protein
MDEKSYARKSKAGIKSLYCVLKSNKIPIKIITTTWGGGLYTLKTAIKIFRTNSRTARGFVTCKQGKALNAPSSVFALRQIHLPHKGEGFRVAPKQKRATRALLIAYKAICRSVITMKKLTLCHIEFLSSAEGVADVCYRKPRKFEGLRDALRHRPDSSK